jgi:predicted nucleic acid-binding protein
VTLVIDASVAAKWVMPEPGADRAASLREADDELIAPSLIAAEIGSAIWKRAMWRELSLTDATHATEAALALLTRLVPMEELTTRALEMAIGLKHPIYDCFYLALAERERAPLICADAALAAKAKTLKSIEIRML